MTLIAAKTDCVRVCQHYGNIPWMIPLAMAGIETGNLQHVPLNPDGTSTNNVLGIKWVPSMWRKKSTLQNTKEYIDGKLVSQKAVFCAYYDLADCFGHFCQIVRFSSIYSDIWTSDNPTVDEIIDGIAKKWSTNPQYGDMIRTYIRSNREVFFDEKVDVNKLMTGE